MKKTKAQMFAGREKLLDKKIPVTLFYEASLIIGEENLPFNKDNPEHRQKLKEFKEQIYKL